MLPLSKIDIEISGNPLKYFEDVNIHENIYGIDNFEITCRYNTIEKSDGFLIENAKDFLGSSIKIQTKIEVGDQEKDGLFFDGIVTEIQGTRSAISDNDKIIISGGSKEILLNGKPNTRAFVDHTLEEIVNEVLKPYASHKLGKKISSGDSFRYPYIVQYGENDLEFLKRLSIRHGEWFFFDGNDVVFGKLPKSQQNLTIGHNLDDLEYQLRVNPVKFSLTSVDPLTRDLYKFTSGKKAESNLNIYGKHALNESKELYKSEGVDYYEHLNSKESDYRSALQKAVERDEISDALNLSDISGSSSNVFLTPGINVKVSCLNSKGTAKISYLSYIVTSVQHSFDNLLHYNNRFTAIPAESSIPENTDPHFIKTTCNQVGKVADNEDPKKLGRVRIKFWWMEGTNDMTPWIKVVTPYNQANSGFYFVPAVNSRVLIGFEGGDIEKPYCLGALFDETHKPDSAWAGDYNKKDAKVHAIRTVSGQTIELHDESGKEKIRIYDTNNKNEITLDSAKGNIVIKATNKLTIEAKEISIKAQNGIKIEAGQGLEHKANEIKSEAQTTLVQKAMDINNEAQISFKTKAVTVEIAANASLKAEGTASAEVSSGGIMTVKGSVVMIN